MVNRILSHGRLHVESRGVPPSAWLVMGVLALSMVALNHSFDVVGGRFEETVTSGAQLHLQEQSESQVTGGTLLRKMGLAGLLSTGALALIILPANGIHIRGGALAVLSAALFAWTGASLVWSTDATKTVHELIRLAVYVLTSIILVSRFTLREMVWMFLLVSSVAIGFDVAADVAAGTFRPWMSDFRMGGALHPNHIGRLGAIVAIIGLALTWQPQFRRWAWAFFAAGSVVVVISISRSSLIGMLAGLAAVVLLGMPARRFMFFGLGAVLAIAVGIGVFAVSPPSVQSQLFGAALMGRTEDAASLTGRGPLWAQMWRDSANRRLQGYGYGAYWTVDRNYDLAGVIEWYPTHSHSVYMELLIDLGFVGLALCLAVTLLSIAGYSHLVRNTGRIEFRILGALFVCALANGFFEVSFVWPRLEGIFLGMAMLALFMHPETDLQHTPATAVEHNLRPYSPASLLT